MDMLIIVHIILIVGIVGGIAVVAILIKKEEVLLATIMLIAVACILISADFLSRGLPTDSSRFVVGEKYMVVVVYKKYIITRSVKNDLLFIKNDKDIISSFVVGSSYIYTSNKKLEKLE